jgi:general secretion pathway protein D
MPVPNRQAPPPAGGAPGMPRPYVPGRPPEAARPRPAPGPTPGPVQLGPGTSSDRLASGPAISTSRADSRCVPLKGRFLMTFNKADIIDVIEQASRWTCRNFAFTEDIARGKISLLSKTPVSAEEAYAAFLAALTANGIAIYPSGKYYRLMRLAEAKKMPIPTILEDGREVPANEQPVTKVMRLHYVDADQIRGVMSNFMSPQGADIQSIPPDVLIITDIGLNVRRMERLIDSIDKPGSGDSIRVIQVQFAAAKDLAEKINQVFTSGGGQPGRPGRRNMIGGMVAAPGGPSAPPPGAGAQPTEVSIQKVIADDRTNKLIIIADDKSFERILDLVKQLDVPAAGEGAIHVVFLKNASAEDMAQTLQALAQGTSSARRGGGPQGPVVTVPGQPAPARAGATTADLLGGEVKVTADKAQNALVIMANGSDFATLQRIIEKLDRARRQVFIEAVIVEIDVNRSSDFGVSAHAAIPVKTSDGTGFIPLTSQTGRVSSINPLSALSLGGFLTGMVGPVSADLKDLLGNSFPSIGVMIQALQKSSDANILSTPHVLASDNEEAEIAVGSNVPFPANAIPSNLSSLASSSSTAASTASLLSGVNLYPQIQRQNVELKLKIKPQINEGDMVRLELEEQTEDIESNDATLGPTTSKRSIKTKIVAKDQHTIVIGGLIKDKTTKSVTKIPLLGDIPILGNFFRDTQTVKSKTNLLLFLTPYIIRDESDYKRIYERKRAEQDAFSEQFYGKKGFYQVPIDFARKAGSFSRMHKDVVLESEKLENGGAGLPGERTVGPDTKKAPDARRAPDANAPADGDSTAPKKKAPPPSDPADADSPASDAPPGE